MRCRKAFSLFRRLFLTLGFLKAPGTGGGGKILAEDGSAILAEDGGFILSEN